MTRKPVDWLTVFLLCLTPSVTGAQTPTVNPTVAEFNVAANHNAIHTNGIAIVDHYEFEIVIQSNGALFLTVGLGKPVAANGARVTLPVSQLATLPYDVIHYATVAAIGPGGLGRSGPSNLFMRAGPVPAPAPASGLAVR